MNEKRAPWPSIPLRVRFDPHLSAVIPVDEHKIADREHAGNRPPNERQSEPIGIRRAGVSGERILMHDSGAEHDRENPSCARSHQTADEDAGADKGCEFAPPPLAKEGGDAASRDSGKG